ncbi:MAG: hypothetical protein NZM10_06650 [Fimbriimonadales bacterium]|nr:hypothetical protein [Fimbriimonadales bacterium]MCS7190179.1 hypothetical protein [Fimbriimonadales bacterium]
MMRSLFVLGVVSVLTLSVPAQTLVSIGNGISGDGRLVIPVDPFGAWYANFANGANRGEFYDPVGALGEDYPTFAAGVYLFVGTTYRVALNQEPGWGSPTWAGNLTRAVVSGPTAFNYAYNDGVNDTMTSQFTLTSGDGVVNLAVDTLVAVRRPSYVIVRYRVTNNASNAINFKLYRIWDLDLLEPNENLLNFYEDDEVCGGVFGGQGYASQRESGNPPLQFALSSLNAITGYAAAKRTFRDPSWPPDCPTMGYGVDVQEWNAYGIPSCWLNYVAYHGPGPGCSGSSFTQGSRGFGDAHIGVEVPVALPAGGSAEVIFIHTYGSGQPATCNLADVTLDGVVDDADLLQVLFAFGNSAPNAGPDANLDGVVDDADLLQVLFAFGSSCGS